jgi:hypothetical protein
MTVRRPEWLPDSILRQKSFYFQLPGHGFRKPSQGFALTNRMKNYTMRRLYSGRNHAGPVRQTKGDEHGKDR